MIEKQLRTTRAYVVPHWQMLIYTATGTSTNRRTDWFYRRYWQSKVSPDITHARETSL